MQTTATEKMRLHIVLTNTAREALKQHVPDEHAFFNLQKAFVVFVEKLETDGTQLSLTLYFDPVVNKGLAKKFPERVCIMDCLFDLKSGLVAKSFRTRGIGTPVATNRRERLLVHFVPTRINGHTYPDQFISSLAALPFSKERYDYVNKRISSWEGYLKVLNKNAEIEDIEANFSSPRFNAEFSHVVMQLSGLDAKQWKQLKGLSSRVRGFHKDLGDVVKVNRGERTVEIELKPDMARMARKNELHFEFNKIEFSNAATKAQLQRLLRGFERLKEGLAANANLENILFEDKPVIAERRKDVELEFHNNLNEFQRAAVVGAMSAEDLYVIQGPPGTGKTTVISEICYQNAKAGLKTLVASQSNLAVDNALSRLLSNKDIRILRYGRTESIEEEGKKFIEENVSAYWKEQTYEAISAEVSEHAVKEQKLLQEIEATKDKITSYETQKLGLEKQIEKKQQAEIRLSELHEMITALKKQLGSLKKEREETEAALEKLRGNITSYETDIAKLEEDLAQYDSEESVRKRLKDATQQFDEVSQELELAELLEEQSHGSQQLAAVEEKLANLTGGATAIEAQAEEITALKKVYEVESYLEAHGLRRSYVLDRLLMSLDERQKQLEAYKGIKDVASRLEKAIVYSETTLGIHVEHLPLPPQHSYSIHEVSDFLSKLSKAFVEKKINMSNGTRSIQGLHLRKSYIDEQLQRYNALIQDTIIIFERLKEALIEVLKEQQGANESVIESMRDQIQKWKDKLSVTTMHIESLPVKKARPAETLRTIRLNADKTKKEMANILTIISELASKKDQKTAALQVIVKELESGEKLLAKTIADFKEVNSSGLALEKEREELEALVKQNPEEALAGIAGKLAACIEKIGKLEEQIKLLPVTQNLQKQWQSMLESANEHDLDEIRKLYVKHANVIGTTCVASANREFMDNYPTFDVVIVDEVSKATPPELLLPMLKGAKIILVGDHHQLPPLIGDETFEETLEQVVKESDTFEQKRELEKLLEESLFERLYKNLPRANKTMLAIQYRMHENIMKTITPFYKNESDELKCGLPDSDALRNHQLVTSHFDLHNHLLWFDVPNEKRYFEQRMQEGSSLYNESELSTIKKLLLEMNEATEKAKRDGRLSADTLKSVGVISFYAEQVKRINRLVEQEISVPHLHIRTGSVDKFQGMEMDIILVSMVRNNGGNGEIGFAKDYRRLNVALSRARELLALIGSTEMFTQKPKKREVRDMYSHVLDTVKTQDGYRAFKEA
ncbi:DEAD/DEAH box helicase [Lysinibacillus odysseyi]|uniref:DNA helicase n=2 Tax=Lysinibacillus odysseyi TaxID=202611 RepID=A0A0A3IEM9_9BACI|nr:AAA domain-containing protein [Lysinibacillus odysseyi]KGR81930.1 DNA helicase [Lysinibacillus odysseyi 34hs-1 = NBRC 100172]